MHLHSYLRSATEIIRLYRGAMPLSSWLKIHFKQHKKFGSRDRKIITDLCFCYYRLGHAFGKEPVEERLLIAQFLCNEESPFINEYKTEWSLQSSSSVKDKMDFFKTDPASIFPFNDELSTEIDEKAFNLSHLIQPDLFLRVRPGKENIVVEKLKDAKVDFSKGNDCLRLSNQTKLQAILFIDEEVVVQDKSSQHSLDVLKLQTSNFKLQTFSAWDCCAASGGKTILLHDHFSKAQLIVSDIRESILHNLRSRFKRAGIHQYQSFVADISSPQFSLDKKFDLVICDAPCSGSGTWSRTPEQLQLFQKEKIEYYADLQNKIAINASKQIKRGGYFLYITCSVFKKENEDVVDFIQQQTQLKLMRKQYYKGYGEKADTIFTSLFSL